MTVSASKKSELRAKRYEEGFRVMQGEREYVTYPDNASLRVWYSNVPWKYDLHLHSAVEVLMTLEGTVDYVVNGTVYTVRKDEILIIPGETPHSLSMGANSSRYLYLFEPETLKSLRDLKIIPGLFDRVFHLRDGSGAHHQIREMLLKIQSLDSEKDIAWNARSYGCLIQIYSLLAQHYLAGAVSWKKDSAGGVDQEVIATAMNYINEHYQEELTLDDVAAFAGFSRFYFSRSFKKQTGYFFKDYLCRKRLQVAKDLLTQTNLSMREVAIRSGFGSVATFNRAFKEKNDCTPSRYRALYGNE